MRLMVSTEAAERIAELCRMAEINEEDFLATDGHTVDHRGGGTLTLKHEASGAAIVLGRHEWSIDPEGEKDDFIDVSPGDILLDETGVRRLASSVTSMSAAPKIKWSPTTNRVIIVVHEQNGKSRHLDILPGEWRPSRKNTRGH